MSVLVFVGVTAAAAVLSFATRRRRIAGGIVAAVGLLAALIAALAIRTDDRLEIAGSALVGTTYGRLFLVLGLAVLAGILVIGRLAAWHRTAPAAVLGGAAALGLAVATPDQAPALIAAAAAALVGTLVILVHPVTPSRVRAMGREVRGAVVGLVLGLVAVSVVPVDEPGTAAGPVAAGFALLAAAVAVGHRLAAFPLHARASRLVDTAPAVALPLLLAWIPAGWALVLLGWSDAAISPASDVLGVERMLLEALACATLVGGAIAALIADEVEKVVAYTIVADAGVVLLAFAALDPQAYVAIRAWLVLFVAAKAALVAVAIALRAAYGTGRLRELGGWARRSPALALGLGVLLVAAIGWPGSTTWDARQRLLEPAFGGPALYLGFLATLGAATAIARVLSIGLARQAAAVVGGAGDRPIGLALPRPRARSAHEPGPAPGGGQGRLEAGDGRDRGPAMPSDTEAPAAVPAPSERSTAATVAGGEDPALPPQAGVPGPATPAWGNPSRPLLLRPTASRPVSDRQRPKSGRQRPTSAFPGRPRRMSRLCRRPPRSAHLQPPSRTRQASPAWRRSTGRRRRPTSSRRAPARRARRTRTTARRARSAGRSRPPAPGSPRRCPAVPAGPRIGATPPAGGTRPEHRPAGASSPAARPPAASPAHGAAWQAPRALPSCPSTGGRRHRSPGAERSRGRGTCSRPTGPRSGRSWRSSWPRRRCSPPPERSASRRRPPDHSRRARPRRPRSPSPASPPRAPGRPAVAQP